MRRSLALLLAPTLIAACGGGHSTTSTVDHPTAADHPLFDGGSADLAIAGYDSQLDSFLPMMPLSIVTGVGDATTGDGAMNASADVSCAGKASPEKPSTSAITINGVLSDFVSGSPVASATVSLYSSADYSKPVIGTATTNSSGAFSLMAPAGTTYLFLKSTASGYDDTLIPWKRFDKSGATAALAIEAVSTFSVTLLGGAGGVSPAAGTTIVAGRLVDCNYRAMQYGIVEARTLAGRPIQGLQYFYFTGGSSPLPTSYSKQKWTNNNGDFGIVQIPVSGNDDRIEAFGIPAGMTAITQVGDAPFPLVTPGGSSPNTVVLITVPPYTLM